MYRYRTRTKQEFLCDTVFKWGRSNI